MDPVFLHKQYFVLNYNLEGLTEKKSSLVTGEWDSWVISDYKTGQELKQRNLYKDRRNLRVCGNEVENRHIHWLFV